MLILRHNNLSVEDLFQIESKMLKISDPKEPYTYSLEFTLLDKPRAVIYGMLLGYAERLGVYRTLDITPSEFLDFLIDVDLGYHVNPYHSFYHAADVAIVIYHMLFQFDVLSYLSRIDVAALFIAALCHDIGHPGCNNNYQVNLQTQLAIRYNNKSVLESYSCTLAMDLISKHKLLRNVERVSSKHTILPTTEDQMRTSIVKMILSTDMVFHYELQENLASLLEIVAQEHPEQLQQQQGDNGSITSSSSEESSSTLINNSNNNDISTTTANSGTDNNGNKTQMKDIFETKGDKSPLQNFDQQSYFNEAPPTITPSTSTKRIATSFSSAARATAVVEETPSAPLDDDFDDNSDKFLDYKERQMLCQIILHGADISNALRPWPICCKWSDLVCEEFFRQGELEKEHGLPVSPNMDRNQVTQTTIGLQFGDFVVSPYFEIFAAMFPKAETLVEELAKNRNEWLALEETQEQKGDNRERQPTDMLPDRHILNPSGRRVSVAAGMIVIPDDLEERVIGSGKSRRKYLGLRSISDTGIKDQEKLLHHSHHKASSPILHVIGNDRSRRKSEEPSYFLYRNELKVQKGRRLSRGDLVDKCLERQRRVASPR
ncbi:hypothetical protein BDC45DRAFT_466054 [Circinella umbellata]|nr:hypothetical protein BDC45DRAFT_466054 [Circinella umbellata]